MRLLLVPLLAASTLAHADLYRWVDPASGSVKLSNTPPPWYERGGGPQVERLPYAEPAARVPDNPSATPRARWLDMLRAVTLEPTRERFEALQALRQELDRLDAAGAAARRAEQVEVARKLERR